MTKPNIIQLLAQTNTIEELDDADLIAIVGGQVSDTQGGSCVCVTDPCPCSKLSTQSYEN